MILVRSKAPLRISFCGGGTDVQPYVDECGGVVLSATIDKYAYTSLRIAESRDIVIRSLDYDIMAKYNIDDELLYNGELDLVKAVIKRMDSNRQHGYEIFIHSDAPPGSGLGSSSTMVVALLGLFKHLRRMPLTSYEIADLAYQVERKELEIKGGLQDQYAATFGGFNFIEFTSTAVVVNPLRIPIETINELEYNLLLCYTGQTRLSANIISTQTAGYTERKPDVVSALNEFKQITIEMKKLLLQGRLNDFGRLLHTAWENKKHLAEQITSPHIDALYAAARRHGALGGKILGAGGGGYLLLYCEFDKKHIVAEELEKLGGQLVEFTFENRGLQTWDVRP